MQAILTGKKILITGGTGFIGSALVEKLKKNNKVFVVGNNGKPPAGVGFIKADLAKNTALNFLKDGRFDYIFHLAGNTDHGRSFSDPAYDLEINFLSTFYILDKIRKFKHKPKLIFASTVLVYGNSKGILSEDSTPTIPISNHGAAKLAAEKYIFTFSRQYDIQAISLRIFSVYGPGLRRQIVFDFMKKLTSNPDALEIIGTGNEARDMVFIDDLAANIIHVARVAHYKGETYNMGTGRAYATKLIAKTVAESMHLKPKLTFSNRVRAFDVRFTVADARKSNKVGCKFNTSFKDGVKRTVEWYKSQINKQ